MHPTETLENRSSEQLLPLVYDELRRLAASRMARESAGMTLQPTALVHEAWLRLSGSGDRNWNDRAHFFRAAALAMRRILVDRARQKISIKGGGRRAELATGPLETTHPTADERLLVIDESLQRLEKEDPESARIILLKFFAGLTNQEAAATMGVNVRTIERQWAYARASLLQIVREIEIASR
ncbi:MAG: ECF-type sigma factor [Luteolibacter sp.]